MKTLSIIIPVFNEEKTLSELLKRVRSANLPRGVKRKIVVIDDGSTDKTKNILKDIKKTKNIKLLKNTQNKGKGYSVVKGIKATKSDMYIIQDADLEYDPNDYQKLISPILQGKSQVVYGTRLKNYPLRLTGKKKTPLATHYLGNKFLTLITNVLYGNGVTDMETCYKVFASDVWKRIGNIEAKRFEFEPEITAKILKAGYKIIEIPIKVSPRGYDEGKKISWKDGFIALWTLIKFRFS